MCVRAGSVAHPRNYAHWSAFRILAAWPHPPKPLTPNVGVTAATNLFIWTLANEDRAVCRSPRGEGSPSAFCGGRDGDYADRVFAFDDLVLSLAQTAKPSAVRSQRLAFVPHTSRFLGLEIKRRPTAQSK